MSREQMTLRERLVLAGKIAPLYRTTIKLTDRCVTRKCVDVSWEYDEEGGNPIYNFYSSLWNGHALFCHIPSCNEMPVTDGKNKDQLTLDSMDWTWDGTRWNKEYARGAKRSFTECDNAMRMFRDETVRNIYNLRDYFYDSRSVARLGIPVILVKQGTEERFRVFQGNDVPGSKYYQYYPSDEAGWTDAITSMPNDRYVSFVSNGKEVSLDTSGEGWLIDPECRASLEARLADMKNWITEFVRRTAQRPKVVLGDQW